MSSLTKAALLVAGLALGACSNTGLFDNPLNRSGASADAGDVADQSSPAYFQEAVGDRVLFEVDQSTLSDAARQTLVAQANWLMENPAFDAVIEGHADEQGTREYNLALGARRASSVREYLVSRGVAENRLRTVSYGKERPLEVCSAESCYARNRRAVTVIAAGGTS